MIVGGYTLHLYCDNNKTIKYHDGIHDWSEFPDEYSGDDKADCHRDARRIGWLISKDRQLCPKCSGK